MVPRPVPQSPAPPLIPEFFAGREVFITGGTGFMGKVLVERLLWTCRGVARLHLLVRHKKDCAPEKRLAQLKQSQVFDVIRAHCPQQLDKLSMLPGDVTRPRFGLDQHSLSQLHQVSVVFHSAATLKFDEPLGVAVEQNLRSVITLMDICDQLPNMQVLVHVSTAYSNAELTHVEERVYAAPAPLPRLLSLVDALPQELLAEITPKLISPKPNTYTFTKAMAESAVAERAANAKYATAIFRPSIVISSLRDPFPGWIENLNGPSGATVGAGKGLLHVLSCGGARGADMIPVDIAIDTLIAVAWEAAVDDTREARVYNCSSCSNPTTWSQFRTNMLRGVRAHPFDNVLWYPFGLLIENTVMQRIMATALQTVPLHIVHYISKLCGMKPRPSLSTVNKRLTAMNDALKFFAMREWFFSTDNVRRLRQRLSPADAAVYNLDPSTIDWEDHIIDFVKGCRKYLLREKDQDIERAQRRMHMLYMIHMATNLFLSLLLCRLALRQGPAILRAIASLNRLRKNGVALHT
ncbi:hypothetical protein PYW08_011062 [Mythimna loreyi]|uniref:Uncharacterized protein n=1 Tax=Mythimna loreyi TaxID=667449 RepID=A0ACC2Q279_9NEOP|nr:hypothetical protein PYW08_011062 [Mythimna loreyi]